MTTTKAKRVAANPSTTPEWAADQVQRWPVGKLTQYPQNPRLHPPGNIAEIRASIQRYGFTIPLLVDSKGEVIAGAGRLQAALQLGLTEVPVVIAPDHWTEEDRKAYRILDNSLALGSVWSAELLKLEISELKLIDYDLSSFNVEPAELLNISNIELEPPMTIPRPPRNKATLFITVPRDRADEARRACAKALDALDIAHNI